MATPITHTFKSMTKIQTTLGSVILNKFTQKHAKHSHHRDPTKDQNLIKALRSNQFHLIKRVPSFWKGHATFNLVLIVETASQQLLVVLKEVKDSLLLVTSYPPRAKQLAKWTA